MGINLDKVYIKECNEIYKHLCEHTKVHAYFYALGATKEALDAISKLDENKSHALLATAYGPAFFDYLIRLETVFYDFWNSPLEALPKKMTLEEAIDALHVHEYKDEDFTEASIKIRLDTLSIQ